MNAFGTVTGRYRKRSKRLDSTGAIPRLFVQFASSSFGGRFVRLDAARRNLPEHAPKRLSVLAHEQNPIVRERCDDADGTLMFENIESMFAAVGIAYAIDVDAKDQSLEGER